MHYNQGYYKPEKAHELVSPYLTVHHPFTHCLHRISFNHAQDGNPRSRGTAASQTRTPNTRRSTIQLYTIPATICRDITHVCSLSHYQSFSSRSGSYAVDLGQWESNCKDLTCTCVKLYTEIVYWLKLAACFTAKKPERRMKPEPRGVLFSIDWMQLINQCHSVTRSIKQHMLY